MNTLIVAIVLSLGSWEKQEMETCYGPTPCQEYHKDGERILAIYHQYHTKYLRWDGEQWQQLYETWKA